MSDKLQENMQKVMDVVPTPSRYQNDLREVVRDIMKESYIQGSNDHHAATQAAQTATAGLMDREQAIDLLMLLSALESHMMSHGQRVPDYLIERLAEAVDMLKEEVMA